MVHRKTKETDNIGRTIELYNAYPYKEKFFDSSLSKEMGTIERLTGVEAFRQQIISGATEKVIRDSWEPELSEYKKMRIKCLLYQ